MPTPIFALPLSHYKKMKPNANSRMRGSTKSLDDWYRQINGIYLDRNFYRTLDSVFLHFVEVSRTLQLAGEERKREINPEDFLGKSLAWWFATCGRAGIPSVEKMIWAKFPYICPYCHLERHDAAQCKESDPAKKEIDWQYLREQGQRNIERMPKTLSAWQRMYQHIYPKDDNTKHSTNSRRLSEEIGEVAEAIKVISVAPKYFVCEAPDIFSWLMSFANKFDFDYSLPAGGRLKPREYGLRLEDALEAAYPGCCDYCGFTVCKCPPILPDHLGRIAKEAPVDVVFGSNSALFSPEESIAFFRESQRFVRIADQDVSASKDDLKKLLTDLSAVRVALEQQGNLSSHMVVGFANLLGQVEAMARQGTLLQADVRRIVEFVENQPPPSKQALIAVLSGVAGNAYHGAIFGALLKAFGG